ncbi:MAG: hypothetical protein ACLFUM_12000 [Spirochaetaceae bacterium]
MGDYETIEIPISDRFVVQVVFDELGRHIATRVLDLYANDLAEDGAVSPIRIMLAEDAAEEARQ